MSFALSLNKLYTGAKAGQAARWSACSFFDKVIFAQSSVPPVYALNGAIYPLPGLVPNATYDGVAAFQGHVVLWQGSTLQWSDQADFTNWIPVGQTSSVGNAVTQLPFTQPVAGQSTGLIVMDSNEMIQDSFVRLDDAPNYNFYTVSSVTPFNQIGTGTSAPLTEIFAQTVPATGTTRIYLQAYFPGDVGTIIQVNGQGSYLQVAAKSRYYSGVMTVTGGPGLYVVPSPSGKTLTVDAGVQFVVGDQCSICLINNTVFSGQFICTVTNVNALAGTLTLIGTQYGEFGGLYGQLMGATDQIVPQHYIDVTNVSGVLVSVPARSPLTQAYGFTLTDQGYLGRTATGTVFPAGTTFQALEANEAGTVDNAGDKVNGAILGFALMWDMGYILKNRSIQSVQYVGLPEIFYIRPEITDEGIIGRYSWYVIGSDTMYFLGNREFYSYRGGNQLTPICQAYTKQLFKEFDRSMLDYIFMFHREQDNEIHLVYPVAGNSGSPNRVLVYNYIENSCTIDNYDSTLGGLSAGGAANWVEPVRYIDYQGSYLSCTSTYNTINNGGTQERVNLVGFANAQPVVSAGETGTLPRLVVQGRVYDRKGVAYESSAESADFDFGNSMVWKYGGYLQLNLEIKDLYNDTLGTSPGRPLRLYFQFAGRDNLDSTINYSDPLPIDVSGNGNIFTKVTLQASGRYLRFKVYSNQADIQWRISGYNLIARLGGLY